jgi:RimJ/RimL family protein N-acetyltransferase
MHVSMHNPSTCPAELRTPRLLLRSLGERDIADLVRLAGAREVAASTLLIPNPYREADAMEFLERARESQRDGEAALWAITLANDELCGTMGLHREAAHNRAELGYWIGVPFWGKGYCTEAARAVIGYGFREWKLHRIFAMTFPDNAASRRVLEKAGMRYEGRLRGHVLRWGQALDLDCYGMVAGELVAG